MKLIVCVCDYSRRRHFYNRPLPDRIQVLSSGEGNNQAKIKTVRRLQLELDAVIGNYVLREVLQQQVLHDLLLHDLGVQLLWLAFRPPERLAIDYKWADMLAHTICRHIELEQLMCWLSTLGGGYSALGDQFEGCAQAAGQISLQQLTIGLRLGDPFVQARCKLYYSISLIQRGQLRRAKFLIRAQYRFACGEHKKHDRRLVHMCLGIWQRLCYEYEQRQRRRLIGKSK
ncbi:uncharacterized protein F58A4.6 [Drosophila virilis]|uniref:CG12123-RA protein n=1 Tax=Drosophila virilis TaxID=7244 RepID=B4LH31_DROVI|nr:uncharacterized protein F58A4.6 [Drosophila virilis]EDW69521.1 uncharacterized protein Dvir_GJ13291 [Drosophila virilis]